MPAVPARAWSGSGLAGALDLLTPPFAAASPRERVPLVGGALEITGPRLAPAVLVVLRRSLARTAVVVRASVGGEDLAPAVFGAYSTSGSMLPLHTPAIAVTDAAAGATGAFTIAVQVWHLAGPGVAEVAHDHAAVLRRTDEVGDPLADPAAADLVEAMVVEGTLARLLLLTTLEKQRLQSVTREIAASRHVSLARAGGLDLIGGDLLVPRLGDEGDDAYRARLSLYSSWRTATPRGFADALNGPGGPEEANRGLPSLVGVGSRFRIVDQAEQLAVTMRLVEVPGGAGAATRDRLADLLTAGLMIDLRRLPPPHLPAATRERLQAVRTTLLGSFTLGTGPSAPRFMSVLTATSMARAARLLGALTGDGTLDLQRAWTREPDPRHELGQGLLVARVETARLDAARASALAARAALVAGEPVELPGQDGSRIEPELLVLIGGLEPRSAADDPLGAWLFTAAGLATVTAPDEATVYLSPLPSLGLVIDGPAELAPGEKAVYAARLRVNDASGRHVLVDEAWERARPAIEDPLVVGEPLSPAELAALLHEMAEVMTDVPPALAPLVALGLAPALPGELAGRIVEAYDLDQLLAVPLTEPTGPSDPGSPAARALRERIVARSDALIAHGFHSVRVLPAPDGTSLVLLAALSALPGGANRPGQPPPAAYRWYVAELPTATSRGAPVALRRSAGGATVLAGRHPGLALLVCVAYVRRGLADPFEVRIELDDDSVLSMDQYGYVMNLLEHLCPLGIEINTFDLRRSHVSVDGAPPQLLSSQVSRSYTRYVRRRSTRTDRYPAPLDH